MPPKSHREIVQESEDHQADLQNVPDERTALIMALKFHSERLAREHLEQGERIERDREEGEIFRGESHISFNKEKEKMRKTEKSKTEKKDRGQSCSSLAAEPGS